MPSVKRKGHEVFLFNEEEGEKKIKIEDSRRKAKK